MTSLDAKEECQRQTSGLLDFIPTLSFTFKLQFNPHFLAGCASRLATDNPSVVVQLVVQDNAAYIQYLPVPE